MRAKLRNISFEVDENYFPEFWYHFNTGRWEPETFSILDYFIRTNCCVIDIGCWVGPISLYAAKKGAFVYSIDPDTEAYVSFIHNVNLNPDLEKRIKCFKIAISSFKGRRVLHARKKYGYSSTSLLNRIRDNVHDAETRVMCLRDFIRTNKINRIDILKIDIEGEEFNIIDQLLELKESNEYKCLLLSLHYDHLNEAIYREKIKFKLLSLVLLKLEKLTGQYIFKKAILTHLNKVAELLKKFNYTYSLNGDSLSSVADIPSYLFHHQSDLFLTDVAWKN